MLKFKHILSKEDIDILNKAIDILSKQPLVHIEPSFIEDIKEICVVNGQYNIIENESIIEDLSAIKRPNQSETIPMSKNKK